MKWEFSKIPIFLLPKFLNQQVSFWVTLQSTSDTYELQVYFPEFILTKKNCSHKTSLMNPISA